MNEFTEEEQVLLEQARTAALSAYCPYSHFPVGAAVATEVGHFTGCNVENASYGLSICAEQIAIFTAIAAGAHQVHQIAVCCLNAGPDEPPGSRMPCGACRQVMAEFMPPEGVVLVDGAGKWRVSELLPQAFLLKPTE